MSNSCQCICQQGWVGFRRNSYVSVPLSVSRRIFNVPAWSSSVGILTAASLGHASTADIVASGTIVTSSFSMLDIALNLCKHDRL